MHDVRNRSRPRGVGVSATDEAAATEAASLADAVLEAETERQAAQQEEQVLFADDLLLIARSDRGQLPLRREEIDTDDLLRGMAERFEQRLATAGREIGVEGPDWLVVDEIALPRRGPVQSS